MVGRDHKKNRRTHVGWDEEVFSWEKDILKLVRCFHMCQLLLLKILMVGFMMGQPTQMCCVRDP